MKVSRFRFARRVGGASADDRRVSSRGNVTGIRSAPSGGDRRILAGLKLFLADRTPDLTQETLQTALQQWQARGPASYDLDVEIGGAQPGDGSCRSSQRRRNASPHATACRCRIGTRTNGPFRANSRCSNANSNSRRIRKAKCRRRRAPSCGCGASSIPGTVIRAASTGMQRAERRKRIGAITLQPR